jgi:excisionase family DNA binding protein
MCETLRISRQTAYRLIGVGKLRPVKIGDRTLFRPEDVEAFVELSLAPERPA